MRPEAHRSEPNTFPGGVIDHERNADGSTALITSTSALTAFSALPVEYTEPQNSTIRRIFQIGHARQIGIGVYGTGADGAGWQAHAYGFRPRDWTGTRAYDPDIGKAYQPVYGILPLLAFNAKLCGYTLAADAAKRDPLTAGGATYRASDTYEIDADYTFGDTAEAVPDLNDVQNYAIIDPMGCGLIAVEMSCLDPDSSANATGVIPFVFRV